MNAKMQGNKKMQTKGLESRSHLVRDGAESHRLWKWLRGGRAATERRCWNATDSVSVLVHARLAGL